MKEIKMLTYDNQIHLCEVLDYKCALNIRIN